MARLNIKNIKLCLLFMLVGYVTTTKAQQTFNTTLVKPKYPEIIEIITTVHKKLDSIGFGWDGNDVFVINVYKSNNIHDITVTIFGKNTFGWFLRENPYTPYGYFEYENIPVIIFGEDSNIIFTKTSTKRTFEWLKVNPPLEKSTFHLNPIFEPPAWYYEFSNGKFKFKNTNWFNGLH